MYNLLIKLFEMVTITTRGFKVKANDAINQHIMTQPTIDDNGNHVYIKGTLDIMTSHPMGLLARAIQAAGYQIRLNNNCQTLTISIASAKTGKVLATIWQNTTKGSQFTMFVNCLTTKIDVWSQYTPALETLIPLTVITYDNKQKTRGLINDMFYASHTGAMQCDFEKPFTPSTMISILNYLERGKLDNNQNS